jgi:Na+/H+ antiporter NhaD/arsenite permease-like protein
MLRFIKKNAVLCIAMLAAAVTCFFVPPDAAYADYFDWKTLSCLFLTLLVVCALRNIKFFTIMARKLVLLSGSLRVLFLVLVTITFVGSLLILGISGNLLGLTKLRLLNMIPAMFLPILFCQFM